VFWIKLRITAYICYLVHVFCSCKYLSFVPQFRKYSCLSTIAPLQLHEFLHFTTARDGKMQKLVSHLNIMRVVLLIFAVCAVSEKNASGSVARSNIMYIDPIL
jgi:hypothetical protein